MSVRSSLIALALGAALVPAHAAPKTDLAGAFVIPAANRIPAVCASTISRARARIGALEKTPLAKIRATRLLADWNAIQMGLEDLNGPLGLAAETHPDPALRSAAVDCVLKLSAFDGEYYQSEALYARVKAAQGKDAVERENLARLLERFDERGVGLAKDKRAAARAAFERIDALAQDFSRNVRDEKTTLAFTEAELAGVPAAYLAQAKRDGEGRLLIGLDYPDAEAVLENASVEASRERFYRAFTRRGGEKNLAILAEVVKQWQVLADLFGEPNYASLILKHHMAGKVEAVQGFLGEVARQVAPVEERELAELTALKRAETGKADAAFRYWDLRYFEQKLRRERFHVDPAEVRAQFPVEPTLNWLFDVSAHLYGLRFAANAKLPVWHKDVKAFDIFDAKTGTYLSSFYLDLYPRDGKYKHAAAFSVRSASRALDRTPVSTLVTNFSREGFSQDQLETLFHEFGHILHGVLSRTRYGMLAGTSVRQDFVEAPSQMYEEWARRPESLKRFSAVCPSCKPIDSGLIARMEEARKFGQGIQFARQWVYASYDMKLTTRPSGDPLADWRAIEEKSRMGYVEDTMFPASFGHLVGGYGAGYYGYMWSLVMAMDMVSAWGDDAMNPEVGARYRRLVLERGGEVPAQQIVEEFLGRKSDSRAFFDEITGQRGAAKKGN